MKLTLLLLLATCSSHNYATSQSTQPDSKPASESQEATPVAKPKPQKVYHVGGDVKAPRVIRSVQPQLDEQQTAKLSAGKTSVKTHPFMLKIVIGEDGTVQSAEVFESSNNHDLDAKAIEAAKQWRFEPATKRGVPVAVQLAVKVDFHLYKSISNGTH